MSYMEWLIDRFEENELKVYTPWGDYTSIKEAKQDVVKMLKYLPEEVLENLCKHYKELILTIPKTVNVFMEEASKRDLLKFKPYVVWDCKVPMLVLKYNRYVHLFRGYHYKVSYTPDGIGEYQSAGIRIDQYRNLVSIKELRQSEFMQAAYYMNCIAACTGIDEFDNLLKDNPEVVDEFVAKSTKAAGLFKVYNMTYRELMSYFVHTTVIFETDLLESGSEYYHVPASKTADYVRVVINRNKHDITFVTPTSSGLDNSFCISSYLINDFIATARKYDDEEDTDEAMEDAYSVIEDSTTYEMLVTFGLNVLGFVANYMVIYPTGANRRQVLRGVDTKDIIALNDISAIQR